MSFNLLKKRIKKNEGYSNKPYKDQLGYYTIGFGHLIKSNENKYFNNTFKKNYYLNLFETDFQQALKEYKKIFFRRDHNQKEKELLIEMLFQLGSKRLAKFRKMLFFLNKKQKYMTCLEMMNSLWYKQTPQRVEDIIKNYIKD